jgi:DNA polymerase III epsilon subunit-like protein
MGPRSKTPVFWTHQTYGGVAMGQADRMNATIWVKEALSRPLVIFDTETTGLHEDAEIVEIPAVKVGVPA